MEKTQGGIVLVKDEQVLASLPLSIGGLMSPLSYEQVNKELHVLHEALKGLDISDAFNPLLTLSFLSLPVIPCLKLTDKGLFDFMSFKHIDIRAN